jgi:serine/threonine-protein kinase RsbW/stage II sporulation protein AB (anti-sigma F factor)
MPDDLDAEAAVELLLDARAEHVAVMRAVAVAAAHAAGLEDERVEDVRLAVGEASANAVVHAYPDAPGALSLLVFETQTDLQFVVRDWGPGIRPRPNSPGLGLGLPLIGALADVVEIRDGDDGATEVRMTFSRPSPAGGPA